MGRCLQGLSTCWGVLYAMCTQYPNPVTSPLQSVLQQVLGSG